MMKSFKINGRLIGKEAPPYIIAEMSANHNGSIDSAFAIIDEAKATGADAVKIQTYTADTITLNSNSDDFMIKGGLWDGRTLYDLYQEAHTPWEWHKQLFDYAREVGITIFSSPFDKTAVDFLEELNTPAYKIASFEAIDLPLISYVAKKGKPMIISTGMANETEINEAVKTAQSSGCNDLAILHCVSGYPAPAEEYNLKTIPDMISKFDLITGLSDHTLDNTIAIGSVALGAAIIEKHFTLNRNAGGPDDSFSLEPDKMRELCRDVKKTWASLGRVDYGRKSSEKGNVKFRRSLYFTNDLKPGEIIRMKDIRSVRPGYGLPPKYFDKIVGKKVIKFVSKNSAVRPELIEPLQ